VSIEPGSHGTTARPPVRQDRRRERLGGDREIAGSRGTQVVKIFDQAAARTLLGDHDAALLLTASKN